jgi:hypothetical protein
MTIPHNVRSIAREAYKHWLYTGRQFSNTGQYYCRVDSNSVTVQTDDKRWIVPVAKSWIY